MRSRRAQWLIAAFGGLLLGIVLALVDFIEWSTIWSALILLLLVGICGFVVLVLHEEYVIARNAGMRPVRAGFRAIRKTLDGFILSK
jgi:hypothetical protein